MKYIVILLFSSLLFAGSANAQSLFARIDSTLKTGNAGYHVICKNDDADKDQLRIRPVGFSNEAKELNFYIKGFVTKAEIGDLNNDGFPDLVLYICLDSAKGLGTVYLFLSDANKSVLTCVLPDPMLDGKINEGYKGHDQFLQMGSYLQQKFPIYRPGDEKDKPTGGTRMVLYQLIRNADGSFKFNKIRFSETK